MYYRPRSRWPGTPKQVTLFRLFTFNNFINDGYSPSHSPAENLVHHSHRQPCLSAVAEGANSPAHRIHRVVPGSTGLQVLCTSHYWVLSLFLINYSFINMTQKPTVIEAPVLATSTVVEDAKPVRNPIPKFLTMRSGSQSPERLLSTSNPEDVKAMVSRQVKAAGGGTRYIAVYQLAFVEVYEPSSRTLSPEQFDDMMEKQAKLETDLANEGL